MTAAGEHQPGGAGPHTPTPPFATLPFEGTGIWSADQGSRDMLTSQGSGRLEQPLCPLQEVHGSTGVPSSADPPLAHRHHTWPTGGKIKLQCYFQALCRAPGHLMPHRSCPMEHPVSHNAVQAQNRLPLPEQKGMWAHPQCLPERRRKHQKSSVHSCQQKQSCGCPVRQPGLRPKRSDCARGESRNPPIAARPSHPAVAQGP